MASVGAKLAGATLVVIAAATGGVVAEVSRHERESRLTAKGEAAAMVARLYVAGLAAPLTFGDEKGAVEQTSLLMATEDVVYGAVWSVTTDEGTPTLQKVGEVRRRPFHVARPTLHRTTDIRRDPERVFVELPVVDATGGVVGVAQVAFSLDKDNAALAELQRRTLLGAGALAFGVSVLLLGLTRLLIVRRLARLATAARSFEEGALVRIDDSGTDEVSTLARALETMTASIAVRERNISERNRDMRRVLDNVAEGFVTVDPSGVMSDERSRVIDEWFGPPTTKSFAAYLEGIDPDLGAWVRMGWESIADDFLPVEVVLAQLGRCFQHAGRWYELEFRPVQNESVLALVLVVIRDVTARVERERDDREHREVIAICRRLLADRSGFEEFLAEGTAIVERFVAGGGDRTTTARALHTLKGIAGTFELESIARYCHELEQRAIDTGEGPTAADREELGARWAGIRRVYEGFGGEGGRGRIAVNRDEHERVLAALERGADHHVLAAVVRSWGDERADDRLRRVSDHLHAIARRLEKADLTVAARVSPLDLRLPADRWSKLWSVLVHVLRNVVDHGIEDRAERIARGKRPAGMVTLAMVADAQGVELTIADDGSGIAWEKIRRRALALGLPAATPKDLEEALYADAVSSRAEATETSGRGIGMGAVRAVVHDYGGSIVIASTPGEGTSFRIRLPAAMLSPTFVRVDEAA